MVLNSAKKKCVGFLFWLLFDFEWRKTKDSLSIIVFECAKSCHDSENRGPNFTSKDLEISVPRG